MNGSGESALESGGRWQRGFWSLFLTQFQGAFSDNAYKFLVMFMIMRTVDAEDQDRLVPLVGALFALPFILFSMAGGYLADRYSKRSVTIGTKLAEIATMTLAILGLALHHIPLLLAVVFLMSSQSAFFGPSKYGLLPELLPKSRLSWGNGVLSLGTFVAIIAGTVTAGWLSVTFASRQVWSGVVLVLLAVAGLGCSLGVTRVPAANLKRRFRINFLSEIAHQLPVIRGDRVLFLAVIGGAYFLFFGALLQPTVLFYGSEILQVDDQIKGYLQGTLAIGIGVGSMAAGYLSGRKIEYGLVPLGALGITVWSILLSRPGLSTVEVGVHLALLGFFGGFYIVPINALIQHRPDPGNKGGAIAVNAFFSWIGVLVSAGFYYVLAVVAGLGPRGIFLIGGLMTLAGTAYVMWLLPDAFLRLLFWCLTHSLYRLRVDGREHVPERGGALLVCNHLSLVDGFLLQASVDRPIRFLIYKGMYEKWWIKPVARILRFIPISSQMRPREMLRSLHTATEAIRTGEVICIFAEGQITRIGQMLPFRRGFEKIMKGVEAPIIPVHLDGVWGSIFSFEEGRFYSKIPHRIPYPVTVTFGKRMSAKATPLKVRQTVQELGTLAWRHRKKWMLPLHRRFVSTARRYPFRFFMADGTQSLRFISALAGAILLGKRLRGVWGRGAMVGICLPPSVAGALVNLAAMLAGKVPVNLNYTVSSVAQASSLERCGITRVVTSRAFLDRLKLEIPCRTVALEEIGANPCWIERLEGLLLAWLMPVRWLERLLGRKEAARMDDLATVIFTSGSTGNPKGAMLTHYQIGSNISQLGQVFAFDRQDRILGVLPFFHSFGFTGTLCLPAALGVGVAYHANPLDARAIGALVADRAVTFALATPTFLQIYLRGCSPEQFGSLKLVMAGAEKLPDRLADAFEDRFGIRPVEGYGCTECSPAVAVSTSDYRAAGFRQVGAKRGKIGHPMPGMSVRIVNPDRFDPAPAGEPGLLLVAGPNVMKGYLGQPEKTAEVILEGWYVTGDIAALDEDGFLTITDRLSRFSKIGGEMVPHVKIEEVLHELADATEQCFAVTGIPDACKGERLVVLHTVDDAVLKSCLEKLEASGLPNLWKPKGNQFRRIERLPVLGAGKLDLRQLRRLAMETAMD